MSKLIELLQIAPEEHTRVNTNETFKCEGFDCPACNGRGFFDYSGYSRKFKKNLEDPDFPECGRCKGAGKLKAKILIEWTPEDLPSKSPPENQE